MKSTSHYDRKYFNWQVKTAEIISRNDIVRFKPYINQKSRVVEFGCGSGWLLAKLKCGRKMGIDINPAALEAARAKGLTVRLSAAEVADNWADIIISSHVLEHTHNPLSEIERLYPKLRKGGLMIFIVPQELRWEYQKGDINQHLYTWSPMSLGNLFTTAGYKVIKVETLKHRLPKIWGKDLDRLIGRKLNGLACSLFAIAAPIIYRIWSNEIMIVAAK